MSEQSKYYNTLGDLVVDADQEPWEPAAPDESQGSSAESGIADPEIVLSPEREVALALAERDEAYRRYDGVLGKTVSEAAGASSQLPQPDDPYNRLEDMLVAASKGIGTFRETLSTAVITNATTARFQENMGVLREKIGAGLIAPMEGAKRGLGVAITAMRSVAGVAEQNIQPGHNVRKMAAAHPEDRATRAELQAYTATGGDVAMVVKEATEFVAQTGEAVARIAEESKGFAELLEHADDRGIPGGDYLRGPLGRLDEDVRELVEAVRTNPDPFSDDVFKIRKSMGSLLSTLQDRIDEVAKHYPAARDTLTRVRDELDGYAGSMLRRQEQLRAAFGQSAE